MTAHTDLGVRDALAVRLIDDTTHALETLSVYLGLELGLYQALNNPEQQPRSRSPQRQALPTGPRARP
jgi:hypothetical protein